MWGPAPRPPAGRPKSQGPAALIPSLPHTQTCAWKGFHGVGVGKGGKGGGNPGLPAPGRCALPQPRELLLHVPRPGHSLVTESKALLLPRLGCGVRVEGWPALAPHLLGLGPPKKKRLPGPRPATWGPPSSAELRILPLAMEAVLRRPGALSPWVPC